MSKQLIVQSDRIINDGMVNFVVSTRADGIIGYFKLHLSSNTQAAANETALTYYKRFHNISSECRIAVQ